MSIKCVRMLALDLDGTTLTSQNTLSQKTKSALEKAVASGIEVVAASGRPFGSMPDSILEIDGINYIISSNGAAIHNADRRCIYRRVLDESAVIKILEITSEYDVIFEAFIDGLTYTDLRYVTEPLKYGCSEAYIDYVRSSHGHVADMRKFIYEHRAELDSVEIVSTDRVLRKKLWLQAEKCIQNVYITSSSENFVEFMSAGATKSLALRHICSILKIDIKNVCACGNADNDADMIRIAGFGAAVKNASPLCLEYADMVVASNNDDGVSELIEQIISN